MRISGGIAAALCACAAVWATSAEANGRYPASTAVRFSIDPSDPDLVVVRATYGVLISRDGGASWRWLCESALGVPPTSVEDPSVELTSSDALVVGLDEGLEVSRDLGCNVACAGGPLAGAPIVDLAVRASAPHAVLALGSAYVFGDAGVAYDTRVWESADDGATWTQRGTLDPAVQVTTIDGAPSDPSRIYVSGTRGFGSSSTASLFVSTDRGATWTERPMPFDATTEVQVFIGAVDPGDADRVYLRSTGAARLYVTSDAGGTFQVPLTLSGPMLGFALSPDGSTVYAGGPQDGLFAGSAASGPDGGVALRKIASLPVECLATRGAELWACADTSSGFIVGAAPAPAPAPADAGRLTFTPRLRNGQLAGPIACAPGAGPFGCQANANASQCSGAAFGQLCSTFGGCDAGGGGSAGSSPPDAGPDAADEVPDGGVSTQAILPPFHGSSCNCATVGAPGAAGLAAGAALVAALAAARARRARRRRGD